MAVVQLEESRQKSSTEKSRPTQTETSKKRFLFVGGIHGVGKTTLTKRIEELYPHIKRIGESVKTDEFVFEHRYKIRDTAEIVWYARYIEMLASAIRDPECNNFVVDRTIFDFVPYSEDMSAKFIESDGAKFLRFVEYLGHSYLNIFLTVGIDVLEDRIRKRQRVNWEEELNTLNMRLLLFSKIADDHNIQIRENNETDDCIAEISRIWPQFFTWGGRTW